MGPPPDPEQILSMLENPQYASTLNEALSNPQVIETMIQQNPMLRDMGPEMRQVMQSPEFRRMMTDPQLMRQTLQMQRMFGGGTSPFGGQRQENSFPAPGATDTTPEGAQASREGQNAQQQGQQQPANPFAMFGNQGGSGANPLASLFNPGAFGTPPAAAGQGASATNPDAPSGNGATQQFGQQQQNPFANPTTNPFIQNPQLMTDFLSAMNPQGNNNSNNAASDSSQPGQGGGQQQPNPLAALMQAMGGTGGGGLNPFAAFGGGSPSPNNPPDNRPPEERYAEQLRQLNDMGFYEFERNVEALRRTGGSVQGAVEYLLTHPGS